MLKLEFGSSISAGEISSRVCYAVTGNGDVSRVFMDSTDSPVLITLPAKVEIARIFMQPSAAHALIVAKSAESFLITLEDGKVAPLPKLSRLVAESVDWADAGALIGTQSGQLCYFSFDQKQFRIVAELSGGQKFLALASTAIFGKTTSRSFFAASQKYLFSFSSPSVEDLSVARAAEFLFSEAPVEHRTSQLVVSDSGELFWLNGAATVLIAEGSVKRTLPHSRFFGEVPKSFALTDFHLIYLLENRAVLVSRISFEAVSSLSLPHANFGQLRSSIISDGNEHYLFSDRKFFQIQIANETAQNWKLFLAQRNFQAALTAAATAAQRATVLKAHGAERLAAGDFRQAADLLAKIPDEFLDFEQVCLQFMGERNIPALLLYLQTRLRSASTAVQASAIFVWCVELLARMIDSADGEEISRSRDALRAFVSERMGALDRTVIRVCYEVLESYGLTSEISWLAESAGDFEVAVSLALEFDGDYEGVLSRLRENSKIAAERKLKIAAQYSPLFFKFCPSQFVDFLLAHAKNLDPAPFLPSALSAGPQGLRFIDGCMHHKTSDLFRVAITLKTASSDESEIVSFIEAHARDTLFDRKFAERACKDHPRALVALQAISGRADLAVKTALSVNDVSLAIKSVVRADDICMRRRLWLEICKSVSKDGVSPVLEIFHQAKGDIELSEVLKLLPEGTPIEAVKKEISRMVDDWKEKSEKLATEIEGHQKALELIKDDLRTAPERCVLLGQDQQCELCRLPLYTKRFFAFICGHCYHIDCMTSFHFARVAPQVREAMQKLDDRRLEERISSDCCLCGDSFLLESVFTPLVDEERDREELDAWAVDDS